MKFMAPKNPGYNLVAKEPEKQYFPDGRERLIRPALIVDFAEQALGMQRYAGYDDAINGRSEPYSALVGGGYFDTEVAQKQHGWTDEERLWVEQVLTDLADNPPKGSEGDVKRYAAPVATPPWPTYDDMHHNSIPEMAKNSGLVAEALEYERRTKNREGLVAKLQELHDLEVGEESLTAA